MSYRDAQALYLEAGWTAPLPLPARAKYPPPEGTTGREAPMPDPGMLKAWLNGHYPDGNLALRLPVGVLGIDVDAHDDKPGAATLASLEARLGPLPDTVISSARPWPSGIRLYRVPAGRAWRDPGPGIEVIHYGWRYVVAWPSIHPNGSPYRWWLWGNAEVPEGQVPNPEELPWLPDAWVTYLDAGELTARVEVDVIEHEWLEMMSRPPYAGSCRIMRESTARHVGALRSGTSRHDDMLRGVQAVVGLAVDGHKGIGQGLAELRGAFLEVTTDRSTWGEWDRALSGAIRKVGASTLLASPPCRCDEPAAARPDAQPAHAEDEASGLYLSVTELSSLPQPPSLIHNVLDGGSLFAITGRDGIYKSFLALDWLACLATGKDWHGARVEPRRVLYVVGEGIYGLEVRVAAWCTAWGRQIHPEWFTIRREPLNLFRGGPAFDELCGRIHEQGYGVILFDTLQRMSSGADTDRAKDASVIMTRLDQLRKATGQGAVGIVAHTGKSDNDTRGSSAFEDDLDIVWKIQGNDSDDDITVELTKRKNGPGGFRHRLRPRLVGGTGSLILEPARGASSTSGRTPKHAVRILELLAAPTGSEGLSTSSLGESIGVRGGAVNVPVNWLVNAGLVRQIKSGTRVRYELTLAGKERLALVKD